MLRSWSVNISTQIRASLHIGCATAGPSNHPPCCLAHAWGLLALWIFTNHCSQCNLMMQIVVVFILIRKYDIIVISLIDV